MFLSVSSIETPPANIGRESKRSMAVIKIAQTNKGILCIDIPGALMFKTVAIKFIAPSKELTPNKCIANIDKSTAGPDWNTIFDKGG